MTDAPDLLGIDGQHLESAQAYHDRIVAATDSAGRLVVAVAEMPGWDIFPYELASLQLKPIQALADEEPARHGEDPASCWCASRPTPGRGGGPTSTGC